jgi:hypothetical protein
MVSAFSIGGLLRSIFGPLHFWVAFAFVEMVKLSVFFVLGLGNMSSFLQTALVMDLRYKYIDELKDSEIASLSPFITSVF